MSSDEYDVLIKEIHRRFTDLDIRLKIQTEKGKHGNYLSSL